MPVPFVVVFVLREGAASMDVRSDGDLADSFWWRRSTQTRRGPLYDTCVVAGLLAAATVVGAVLDRPGLAPSIMIVYVLAVQLCAFFTWSRLYCLLSSAAAVSLYNFLFIEPRYSLTLIDHIHPGMFFIMFVVSLVSSSIALALRRALAQAAASDRRTQMVLETNRMLQRCADEQQIVHAVATQLARLSGCPVVWYSADAEGDNLLPRATYTAVGDAAPLHQLAPQMPPLLSASVYVGTPLDATFGGSAFYGIYLTVRSGDTMVRAGDPASVVGVLAIVAESDALSSEERTLADAIVSEGELALDRARAMEAREEAAVLAKNEQLRANLLRSISHDLRTPLTSISGNADVLLDQGSTGTAVLDAQTRRSMLLSIRSDAQWLNATVENLLAITKLEGGGMHLSTTLELMDDIVEEALRHVNPAVREHDLKVVACDEPALVNVDARLMVQLVVNLVNNAITYTPAGSHIVISIDVDGGRVTCSVADDGPGIAPEDRERIFESFYTANHGLADSHRSVGLGLSLCRSIALAHGGSIEVAAADPHGSVFTIELPAADVSFDKE